MLTTNVYGHRIQCHFKLNEIEENEELIDIETIKKQLNDGTTSCIGIEIINPKHAASAGFISWAIEKQDTKTPAEDEHTVTLLGHLIAYRFPDQPEVKLTNSGEEHIEEGLRQNYWSGEVNESNPEDFEETHFGSWRIL